MIGPCDVLDVSEHQSAPIEWGRVAQNVRHVIVRACYGTRRDMLAQRHADNAHHHAGLTVSLYGYLLPKQDTREQGHLLAQMTRSLGCEGAPWVDLEEGGGLDPDRLAGALMSTLVECDARLSDLKMRTGIYTGPNFWTSNMKGRAGEFKDRALWLAQYGDGPHVPYPWVECALWQHSGNTIARTPDGKEHWGPGAAARPGAKVIARPGHVDGCPGEVDVSALYASVTDMLAGRNTPPNVDLTTTLGRQKALRLLGHDPGRLDGLWGPSSRSALVLVQRQLGIQADGVWGPVTASAVACALQG